MEFDPPFSKTQVTALGGEFSLAFWFRPGANCSGASYYFLSISNCVDIAHQSLDKEQQWRTRMMNNICSARI